LISDDELLAAIDAAEQQALGTLQGEVASDRADAIDRYLGKPYGDEAPGRSSVVSRDVSDVVEGVLANVLKPFVGGDQIIQFDPRGPEDVEAAQQETDYVNFIALERNNGFAVLNCAVKDALLLRAGYVKCGWTSREDVTVERYQGLSEDEMTILMQDKDVEVVEHSEYPDPAAVMPQMGAADAMSMGMGPMSPPEMPSLHDIKVKRKQPTEYVEIEPCPPDEILVSQRVRTPSLQDADFVQHRTHLTLSELRQMDYDVADDIGDDEDGETLEEFSRQRFGTRGDLWDDETQDPARRRVLYKENWIRIDRDGDGIAELRRICVVGRTILADEDCDIIPLASFSSVLMPHQHLGLSVYDLIKDIAQTKTAVQRAFLDSLNLALRPRMGVDVNRVNLDDLLTARAGGVVRTEGHPGESLMPLVSPDVSAPALQGLEYLDSVRENRTGYTRYAQGMESDSLINKTATGLMQAQSQSQVRLEMISRTIAETGVRDMFRIVHALTLKHSTRAEKVRLRNKWVTINPREWARRTDLSISVGLGSASPQMQMQNLMLLAQAQEKAMMLGLVQPSNVYNLLKKITNAAGFKSPEEFFSEPKKQPKMGQDGQPEIGPDGQPVMEDVPPQPPKDPLVQAEEVKGQFGMQKAQMDGQIKGAEIQAKTAADKERLSAEMELERFKAQLQAELEKYKADLKASVDRELGQQQGERELQKAHLDAQIKDRDGERKTQADFVRTEKEAETAKTVARASGKDVDGKMEQVISGLVKALEEFTKSAAAPRKIVRGPDGRAAGTVVG
jgi:hypothetical protein